MIETLLANPLVAQLLGLLVGLFTSFFSWWVLFHVVVPKIEFSPWISKLPTQDDGSGYRHRVKFKNVGRRKIVDLQVTARLAVRDLVFKDTWNAVYIPLNREGERMYDMPAIAPRGERVLRLFVSEVR